jgi:tRNA U38,U39,U40 pseudouridine synthase TruA
MGPQVTLPDEVQKMLNETTLAKVLAMRTETGVHAIPVGSICAPDNQTIAAGAVVMDEASRYLERAKKKGETVSIIVVDPSSFVSYQVRCRVKSSHTSGPIFDYVKKLLSTVGLEPRLVWVFEPLEVIDQSPTHLENIGKRLA